MSKVDEMTSALRLHKWKMEQDRQAAEYKTVTDQFLLASLTAPRKFKSRLHQSQYQGPNARKEAEDAERYRWIRCLADLLTGTPTPTGQVLKQRPGDVGLLGSGRRAGTLRNRGRAIRRFLTWLAMNHGIIYPEEASQYVEHLRVRLAEPCNRGALKNILLAYAFLNEVSGVPHGERPTSSQLYTVILQELPTQATPGRTTQQAPRMLTSMLSGLEGLVCDPTEPIYLRIYAWWTLVANWATLRFSDHRGLKPEDITVSASGFSGSLTWFKTLGADKKVVSRPLTVDNGCFVSHAHWLTQGWEVLRSNADLPRDYLLPAPTTDLHGCKQAELKYDTGAALQNKVLSLVSVSGEKVFAAKTTKYWSPHSCGASLPSAVTALSVPKDLKTIWGDGRHKGVTNTPELQKESLRTSSG